MLKLFIAEHYSTV